jgi:hypothetical protein
MPAGQAAGALAKVGGPNFEIALRILNTKRKTLFCSLTFSPSTTNQTIFVLLADRYFFAVPIEQVVDLNRPVLSENDLSCVKTQKFKSINFQGVHSGSKRLFGIRLSHTKTRSIDRLV